ncbi:ABC transporter substrate-binding protein [Methylobacterium sp. J-059]|uniref:ABC transporter substrate-binding protein n=1 Tax=Methylobacterium sp. J-059 TaxID=2836643 RepID=UPI001FBAC3E2|nr:ABC transporter substrate-binding protein [Methylobacterium sp. J-059]MCJ2042555.1 ABC transporter substrate-binding protein [Methylobacterium sp. J-059]
MTIALRHRPLGAFDRDDHDLWRRASMTVMKRVGLVAAALASLAAAPCPARAETVRIGYWSSGVSLGFGAVLEAGKFMEKEGLTVEYLKFPDVNAPTKAMAAGAIDFAIAASAGTSFSVASDGLPFSIVLATQVADLDFVVPEASPIRTMADLKGKKIGTSPSGSATAAITSAILETNYGIKPSDYESVPGNDPRLAQFLAQKDIDAAALRTVTLALLPDAKLRKLGSFRAEWKAITKQDAPPVLGVGLMRNDWLKANPAGAAKVVAAMRKAYEFGKGDKAAVAQALMAAANLGEADAKAYAALWDHIYTVSMEPADVASLKNEFAVFKAVGVVKGDLPDAALVTGPYEASKAIR